MHRLTTNIRQPVKRPGAEQYMLLTLLSFAISITTTRLFLEVTGYPQLGGGFWHIAHVLWGGLLLFSASLAPLVLANRWVYTLSAILAGAGVGLFIDEVGKFVTASNDYFTPIAAPIIYAFFLLTVLLYLRIRVPHRRDPRIELYHALDGLEEILEHDLDPHERSELEQRLRFVAGQEEQPVMAELADDLLEFLEHEAIELAARRPPLAERLLSWWQDFEGRYIGPLRLRAALTGGLLALSIFILAQTARTVPIGPQPGTLQEMLLRLVEQGILQSESGLNWLLAQIALQTSVGLVLLISASLLIAGKTRSGMAFAYLGLLMALAIVNVLVFYFEQFSTIAMSSVEFVLLLGVLYYRSRYIPKAPPLPDPDARVEDDEFED